MTLKMGTKNLDIILIASGMVIGFFVILMHLTDMWPCKIVDKIGDIFKITGSSGSFVSDSGGTATNSFDKFKYDIHHLLSNLFRCS